MTPENDDIPELLQNDSFSFFVPVERIEKSDGKDDGKRFIQGIASTDDRDLQGEIVTQNGIEYGYFLKHGYINDDHKDGPEHKVGEPVECRLTSKGLWIKAFLYKGKERSDYWWEHINVLLNSGSSRKVGFSIQGKILRRNGKTITKCWLQDVAITASPVNTSTWAEIAKSLSSQKWCVHPWQDECVGGCCGCATKSITATTAEDDTETEEKALSTASGGMLIPQSLEGKPANQTFKSNRISYDEALLFLINEKGYSEPVAKAITDAIFIQYGMG